MTAKDFSKMTTKKLNALLASASEEDQKAIQEVLDARNQAAAELETESELTPEEQAIIDAAEANGGENPMYQGGGKKGGRLKKNKLSDEARATLAAELKEKHLHNKCQVVLFGTVIWADGYIVGVLDEKRSSTVLYRIKLNEEFGGRTIHKAYDSELLKIFDEKMPIAEAREKARNVNREARKGVDRSQPWAEEEIKQAIEDNFQYLGRTCTVTEKESEETKTGRIVGLVPEKRAHTLLLRIKIDTAENEPLKYMHKTVGTAGITISEEIDDKAKEIQDAYISRRAEKPEGEKKPKATPQERMIVLKAQLAKAEEALRKAQEKFDKLQAKIVDCKAEIEESLDEEEKEVESQDNNTEELA